MRKLQRGRCVLACAEALERRRLLATVAVSNTSDILNGNTSSITNLIASNGGDGISLREAITAANATANSGGPDMISFQLTGGGVFTIGFTSTMQSITDPVTIDGTTIPGYAGLPRIQLDGNFGNNNGLLVQASGSGTTIRGLSIGRFSGSGILILGSNNVVEACHLGVDATGTVARGNSNAGVYLMGSAGPITGNRIGGTTAAQRNVISANLVGVVCDGALVSGTLIQGNYIGTDVTGTLDLGNTNQGALITASAGNTVGGAVAGARNVISGNNADGVLIIGAGANGNVVQGNYIGTNAAGSASLANNSYGVDVVGASNTIGGAGAGNVISGNTAGGVLLDGANATVQGNYIGLNAAGTTALANLSAGLRIRNGPAVVGGTATGAGNVISGNTADGIAVENALASGCTIQGNLIGTNAAGTAAVPNGEQGIQAFSGNNLIGGAVAGARNIISGNLMEGVFLTDGTGSTFSGNYIGTNGAGTASLGNAEGIVLVNSSNCVIGGTTTEERNVISGNAFDGIRTTSGNGVRIQGNYIGTNASGTAILRNGDDGIHLASGSNDQVGGTTAGAGNVISGCPNGINVASAAINAIIEGNRIGTNAAGTGALGNVTGIRVVGTNTVTIGGSDPASRNIISGNGLDGINLSSASNCNIRSNYIGTDITGMLPLGNGGSGIAATSMLLPFRIGVDVTRGVNVIAGNGSHGISIASCISPQVTANLIGVGADGVTPIGNGGHGIRLSSVSGATVGGSSPAFRNTIAYNGGNGVVLFGATGGAVITHNSILSNALLGIDLGGDGVTANDAGDADNGPNTLQNYPVITSAVVSAGHTIINGTFNTVANLDFVLHFYQSSSADSSGFGEGETFVYAFEGLTNATGDANFSLDIPQALPASAWLSVTALTGGISSSEFSRAVQVVEAPSFSISDLSVTEGNAGTTAATFTVNRSGNVTAPSSVIYSTANGSAVAPGDYAHVPATQLNFAAGDASKTITVLVSGDTAIEPNETFFVNLSNPVNATIGDAQATGTIINDDATPSVVTSTFVHIGALPTPYEVLFEFSEPVTGPPGGVPLLMRRIDNGQLVATVFANIEGGTLLRGQLTAPLPDGNYRATLPSGSVADVDGDLLAADVDLPFFILGADANRDRYVNTLDFVALATHFNETGANFSQGDFNYDGRVNALDFNLLAINFGTYLAPAAAPSASATTTAAAKPLSSLFGTEKVKTDLEPIV